MNDQRDAVLWILRQLNQAQKLLRMAHSEDDKLSGGAQLGTYAALLDVNHAIDLAKKKLGVTP